VERPEEFSLHDDALSLLHDSSAHTVVVSLFFDKSPGSKR
jgi:hypothetical protein